MFRSYRIGTLFGFPIEVNLTFLLMLGVVLLWWGGLVGVFVVLVAFASVLLHELGHALTARQLGVPVSGIELHFFGGAAKMLGQPRRANHEIAIAAAGPAVSFALGGVGFLLSAIMAWSPLLHQLGQLFGWLNVVIGAFNLTPALPMDGGRILRALLTRKWEFTRATDIAVRISRGIAVVIGLYGLFTLQLYLLLLVAVLWFMGSAELAGARMMGHRFSYDRNGYVLRDDVEVMPPGFAYGGFDGTEPDAGYGPAHPFGLPRMGFQQPVTIGRFVIRRRNGRLVIETLR